MNQPPTLTNFGHNVSISPEQYFEPRTEQEVLAILADCRGKRIRVIGRLHSWSPVIEADQVLINLQYLNEVVVEEREEGVWATVGGGCQIKRLLAELDQQAGVTLPSLGLITEQSIAGATATGTHGSGKQCLSHFVAEVRVACYDKSGNPVIRTINAGDELRAARCSLGCVGVVLSVGLWTRPAYNIAEHWRWHANLSEVIAAEVDYPLQQFFLIPWKWQYVAQHRSEVDQPRSALAPLYRLYCFTVVDVTLHLCLVFITRFLRSRRLSKAFLSWIVPWCLITRWRVVDRSQEMLVMEHELFRHIEIEMFVRQERLPEAMRYVEAFLKHLDGDADAISSSLQAELHEHGLWSSMQEASGSYTHGYPICVRKLLPDNTMISMASGSNEPTYSISFISYVRPGDRASFQRFADLLCRSMGKLFQARPHWGKVCPLTNIEAEQLYDNLALFRDTMVQSDPQGTFRNDWLDKTLFAESLDQ